VTTPRPVVIDTDPGIDDAMAIAVALAAPELDVLALTTTFGNHDLPVTTANAQRILDTLGHPDIPVVPGADRPLLRPRHGPATSVHGDDGLGDAGYPPPSRPPADDHHAAVRIVEEVRARPGEVTVVPIGPLTNLALALRLEPRLVDLVAGVVVMGGAVRVPGNVTPSAEANIWNDPEAAEIVLGAGWPLTLIGLDVTHRVHADRAWLDDLATLDTPAARLVADTAPTYVHFHQVTDGLDGIHCHDAAAIVHLLRPDLFTTERMAVRVVTSGFAAGATVAAARTGVPDAEWEGRPRIDVALGVEADAVLAVVRDHLAAPPTS
jgi:inosine-uridine nucleoside N-ribohydrolase